MFLTKYYESADMEYDNSTGCITKLNKFSEYHNELLKIELSQMRDSYPEVDIIYADYYNAAMQFFQSPNKYGTQLFSFRNISLTLQNQSIMNIDTVFMSFVYCLTIFISGFINGALKACCGGGGPFNYNASVACAEFSSTVCMQPHTYANWDGLHLTEAAYKIIFKSIFEGPYAIPQFDSICPPTMVQEIDGISSSI